MTIQHPYAELLRAIADGKELQFQDSKGEWVERSAVIALHAFAAKAYTLNRYRVKPATITVNGIEVPEPVREPPRGGVDYWIASPVESDMVWTYRWSNDSQDHLFLRRGIIHLSKDAALAHAEAMIAPSKLEAA